MGKKSREKWERRASDCQLTLKDTKVFWGALKKIPVMREFLGRKQQVGPLEVLEALRRRKV